MTQDTVHTILSNALQLEDGFAWTDDVKLQDIPNMDSLAQVRLVAEIEQVAGEPLSMDEILGIESIGNIRELLAAKGK